VFNWWRSRIVRKQKSSIEIYLVRNTAGRLQPEPSMKIKLSRIEVFTRQPQGYYWLTGCLDIPKKPEYHLATERISYAYSMDLSMLPWFEVRLSDWELWENDGELLKTATLTTYLHINDRNCRLTKSQKPANIELWEQ